MDMKQACLVVLVAFICVNVAMADKTEEHPAAKGGATPPGGAAHGAAAGSTGAASPISDAGLLGSATAPSALNGSPAVFPAVGTLLGASLLSIVVFYAQ